MLEEFRVNSAPNGKSVNAANVQWHTFIQHPALFLLMWTGLLSSVSIGFILYGNATKQPSPH